ncbi:hypothetical protein BBO_09064 [Beauveria brongniartii RCEF 3172]|uniref:Uncharacterized protein n=1 Tax=Beauveria brongniartii RCEF 3172 TaxID=1081107 RepID=A0A166WHH9_9HYPO|nr:hypothetical protein BBO_09064 [Beauveria brongniartii RCEF 3172]
MALLAQTALCDRIMHAREVKVTPAPAAAPLAGRQAQKDECREDKTACGDGNGCCPRGAQCTQSKGVDVCADACEGATLFCSFGGGVTLCCQPGASCDYARSVCTQHKTDAGGVWTAASTTEEEGTRLPTAPAFSSTEDVSSTEAAATTTRQTSSQSSSEAASSSGSAADTSGGGATPTKSPKDSGSAVVASWSAGVLAVVFGIMAAL